MIRLNENEEWLEIEREYLSLMTAKNQIDARIRVLKDKMEVISDGEDIQGSNLTLKHQVRRGLVQYKDIPSIIAMSVEELDSFRKPSSVSVVVKMSV